MKYDFKKLSEKQKELDAFIIKSVGDMDENSYWEDRIIALNVELSEVSNEIRFFKFWSKKPASEKEVILDELVDCLHFAFSLGNTLKNDEWLFITDDIKRPIRHIYFDISNKLMELVHNKDLKLFRGMLFNLVEIAWYMGYSMEDLNKAYEIKNKVNYERQNSGY